MTVDSRNIDIFTRCHCFYPETLVTILIRNSVTIIAFLHSVELGQNLEEFLTLLLNVEQS